MADLKLARLPDRAPIKLTISVMPGLHATLLDYAAVYADTYRDQVHLPDLIPYMLLAFLDNDRAFQRMRRERRGEGR